MIELHLDPERADDPLRGVPRVRLLRGRPGAPAARETAPMRWITADQLALEVPMRGAETLLATVEWSDGRRHALPPAVLPYSPEYRPEPPDRGPTALAAIASATGGIERLDVAGIWRDLPRNARWFELAPWLALAAVAVFWLEILQRRTGWLARRPAAPAGPSEREREHARPRRRARAAPEATETPTPAAPPPPTAAPSSPAQEDLRAALRQARRDAERRLRKDE